jgi:CheY-like chemotaxis protein
MNGNALPSGTTPALRVMIVDDDHATTQMFGWMLEMLGYQSCATHSGSEALALAPSFRPGVILLDLGLAGMSGYEACKKLRALPELAQCIFIAQTGWDQPDKIEQSRQAGFHDHWVKPVSMERLQKFLASLTDKAAA